jgi:phosphate-selective porin OprO and OprP
VIRNWHNGARANWCKTVQHSALVILLVARTVLIAHAGEIPATSPSAPKPTTATSERAEANDAGPARLKEEVRIVMNTNAPTADSTNAKSFHWSFACQGWDGLSLELAQQSPMGDPFALLRRETGLSNQVFHLEQVKMTAQIGGRMAVDAAGFVTSGSLQGFDGGAELRRLRVSAQGDCILLVPVSYRIELGYIPNQFDIEESYLAFRDLGFLGTLKMGLYRTPFSLNAYTSTRDIAFMEPAAPVTALAPGVNAGVQVGRGVLGDRMTWTTGLFGAGDGSSDSGDASQDYGRAVIRLTGLPVAQGAPDDPASQRLLHLGLNFNWLYSGSSSVRYRTRPESHLAPYVLDTGDIDATSAFMLDGEAAWTDGPLSLQGEFLAGQLNATQGDKPLFYGFYAQAGWFLTGESRPYIRSQGRFGRIVPRQDFAWKSGGWGAWEVLGRFSYTDLNDGVIQGGRMGLVTAGVNWYPTSHIHWAFNYITGKAEGPDGNGWMNIFESRIELSF